MKRKVSIYKGKEILKVHIDRIKEIAKNRYPVKIYEDYFANIKDVNQLAYSHSSEVNDEVLILGKDWFLCYEEKEFTFNILEWISLDVKEEKMIQIAEMKKVLKDLLIDNSNKLIIADMRHDSSYVIYKKMLDRGYFEQEKSTYAIDGSAPLKIHQIMYECKEVESFINHIEIKNNPEYLKYLLHHISFFVTKKFFDKYIEDKELFKNTTNNRKNPRK